MLPLCSRRACRAPREREPSERPVDPLVDQVRNAPAVGDALNDAAFAVTR